MRFLGSKYHIHVFATRAVPQTCCNIADPVAGWGRVRDGRRRFKRGKGREGE